MKKCVQKALHITIELLILFLLFIAHIWKHNNYKLCLIIKFNFNKEMYQLLLV